MQMLNLAAAATVFAASVSLSACTVGTDGSGVGSSGVPLAELDRSGPVPSTIRLGGPDQVVVTAGAPFDIEVSGDQEAVDALRFSLDDDAFGIGRVSGTTQGRAIVRVTVPKVRGLVLGGSGAIEADRLTGEAEVAIGGSGVVRVADIDAGKLAVSLGGSGTLEGAGRARTLDVSVGGSGDVRLAALEADQASVSVGGSGDVEFSSDGPVSVSLAGSGDVTVNGNARCSISRAGSGNVTCGPVGN